MKSEQIHLVSRPSGVPCEDDFRLVEVEIPELRDGQILVENHWMSVDPYMRRSMDETGKDLEPWPIGGPLDGPSVGRVIQSRHPNFDVGDIVESMSGWQRHFISDGTPFIPYLTPNSSVVKRQHAAAEPGDYVGLLGIASFTAYAGMVCQNPCKPGNTVVISSGAGTVGSLSCQIGRIRGLRVVASAGSDEKVKWLRERIGVDEAFNYKSEALSSSLAKACPNGIDFVLENASPEHFSACLPLMNELATILITGFVSIYSKGGHIENITNFEYVLDRFLTIKAYRFMDYLTSYDQFVEDMLSWRESGKLELKAVVYEGLSAAPRAFCTLLGGGATGKVLVRLGS